MSRKIIDRLRLSELENKRLKEDLRELKEGHTTSAQPFEGEFITPLGVRMKYKVVWPVLYPC